MKSSYYDNIEIFINIFRAVKANEIEIKKPKLEIKDEVDSSADSTLDKSIIAQNKEYFANRDNAKEHLSKQERKAILLNNKQDIPEGEYLVIDRISHCYNKACLSLSFSDFGRFGRSANIWSAKALPNLRGPVRV